jgi:hypothetical protein
LRPRLLRQARAPQGSRTQNGFRKASAGLGEATITSATGFGECGTPVAPSHAMYHALRVLLSIAAAAHLSGCAAFKARQARSEFASDTFCPDATVTITHVVVGPPAPPPADVETTPSRLAMWEGAHHQERHYVVSGCGQVREYKDFRGWVSAIP